MLHQGLRRRLLLVANRVPSTKLEVLKFLCRDVIPIAEMERIRGALPLFSALERRGEISDGKLDFLVTILLQVGLDNLVYELGDVAPYQIPAIPMEERNRRLFTESLGRIAQNLTAEDVQRLSYVFSDSLTVSVDSIFTAVQLFELMSQRQLVTPTCVTSLCQELDHIGRSDMCNILHFYLHETNQANCGVTHVRACPEQRGLSGYTPSVPGSILSSVPGSIPSSVPVFAGGGHMEFIREESNPFLMHSQAYLNGAHTPPYPNGSFTPSAYPCVAHTPPYPNGSFIPSAYPCVAHTPSSNGGPSGLGMGAYRSLSQPTFGIPDNVHPHGPVAPFPGPNDVPPPRPSGSDPSLVGERSLSYKCVEESVPVPLMKHADIPLKSDGQCLPLQKVPEDQLMVSHDRSHDRLTIELLQEALDRKNQELQSLLQERSDNSQWAKVYQGMTSCDPNDLYPMSKDPHGKCIIINNHKFHHPTNEQLSHPDRAGAEVDQGNLIKVFEFLHYKVEVYENLSSGRMIELMLNEAHYNHQPYDSFICFILSHGEEGVIHGSDCSPVNLRDLSGLMKMCPSLTGKPKMFFIQACRGEEDGRAIPLDPDIQSDPASTAKRSTIPDDTDFFFGYATVPGRAAYRSKRRGSWFVTEICRLFLQHAYTHTLVEIMTKVNESISKAYTQDNDKQCTEMVVRLRKQVHFFRLLNMFENGYMNNV